MTHGQLVDAAFRWLKRERCPIIVAELHGGHTETPDVLAWRAYGTTVLVECKASRSDFIADGKKYFRRDPNAGMGAFRYFCAPVGMLKPEELPRGWGLMEVGTKFQIAKESECPCEDEECYHVGFEARNTRGEQALLISLLRRVTGPGVRGKARVYIAAYTRDEHFKLVEPCATCGGTNGRQAP